MPSYDVTTRKWTVESVAVAPYGAVVAGPLEVTTHSVFDCLGPNCVVHNPSNHPLKDAPITLRADKGGVVERICEHGTGHPDPDDMWFRRTHLGEDLLVLTAHGCCGCCRE